jgi:hypothetical protein
VVRAAVVSAVKSLHDQHEASGFGDCVQQVIMTAGITYAFSVRA